jgi:hypothetical protein
MMDIRSLWSDTVGSTIAKLNGTCGNFIQLAQLARW